jgi:hypothetical protein
MRYHRTPRAIATVLGTVLATVAAVLVFTAAPASAATITVTTTADTPAANAPGNPIALREAFAIANTNGTAGDTIVLQAFQTYVLASCDTTDRLEHSAAEDLTVDGNAAAITTVCSEQVLVKSSSTGTLTIDGLTVRGGSSGAVGAGVQGVGDVVINQSTIRDNTAGGGVFAFGDLTVTDSTIVDNTSFGDGGGLAGDTVTVDGSTIARNLAFDAGGGVYASVGAVSVTNSTIVGNTAEDGAGGGVRSDSVASIESSTIVANRAGDGANVFAEDGAITYDSSIIGLGAGGADCSSPGADVSQGQNVGQDGSCAPSVGSDVTDLHPMVAPLASNGYITETMRTVSPSPAIDIQNGPCSPTTDQRNTARPQGGGCDSGAFEGVPQTCTATFPDVPASSQFFDEICWLAQMGITKGFSDGNFRPGQAVTRQSMAAFLYRLALSPPFDANENNPTFDDVGSSHEFLTEIEWLADEEIAGGFLNGTYKPGQAVTRQAMAAFLFRLAGEPGVGIDPPSFSDVPPSHQFFEEISWLANSGVANGFPDGTYKPSQAVTRQAMAAFMLRLAEDVALNGI